MSQSLFVMFIVGREIRTQVSREGDRTPEVDPMATGDAVDVLWFGGHLHQKRPAPSFCNGSQWGLPADGLDRSGFPDCLSRVSGLCGII